MNIPEHLKYTKSHEWVRLEGDTAYVGITDYAQHSLGDIVYVELPDVGRKVGSDEELTTIESVKAAEPIYSPLAGSIAAVNEELNDKPEIINEKPYEAFIFAVKMEDKAACDTLMNAKEYGELVEAEGDD